MAKILLLAETGADIPLELLHQYNITTVPMHVQFGDDTRDDGTFPAEYVVTYHEQHGSLPKTSGSTPGDFTPIFDRLHQEHPDAHILYMAYSSVTTCSYASGRVASEGRPYVHMMDTKHVSAGQCAAVIAMAQWLEANPDCTIEEALEKAEAISGATRMCFMPDTLKFLQAGGRVSNATALVGGLLKIHPVIEIQNGYLNATRKLRGKMDKLAPQLVKDYIAQEHLDTEIIYLIRTPRLSDEIILAAENAAKECGAKAVRWISTGGVITCHGGPGAFGVVGFAK